MSAAILLLIVTGTALATRQPQAADEPQQLAASQEADPDDGLTTADDLAHAADRLAENEISVDDAVLADLASRYGLGGAVRLAAWADETGMSVEELAAMRDGDGTADGGMGWGLMARQLSEELGIDLRPGLGSIMGNGGGHGRDNAPGQQKDRGADEETESGE